MALNTPDHLFCDTITIERSSDAVGTMGGVKKTWSTHLSGVKCYIQTLSATEFKREGRDSTRKIHNIYTATGQDIQSEDRIQYAAWDHPANIFATRDLHYKGAVLVLECEEEES